MEDLHPMFVRRLEVNFDVTLRIDHNCLAL
jgi:hypothetical protein